MRNLKAFGLALVAVFAAAAILASAAPANTFNTAAFATKWTRAANAVQKFQYEFAGKTVECNNITLTAETAGFAFNALSFSPTYANCVVGAIAFSIAEVNMNGCIYQATIGLAPEGPVHLECPVIGGVKQKVTITVKVFGVSVCTYHIAEQTPEGVAAYAKRKCGRIQHKPRAGRNYRDETRCGRMRRRELDHRQVHRPDADHGPRNRWRWRRRQRPSLIADQPLVPAGRSRSRRGPRRAETTARGSVRVRKGDAGPAGQKGKARVWWEVPARACALSLAARTRATDHLSEPSGWLSFLAGRKPILERRDDAQP